MHNVLAMILGGGRGTRLFPLTRDRSKPAVPIGGKYRLIDIPISNCLNSDINRIFVLTQYNTASLHRHINQTFKFDHFSGGFVEILAAEQTMDTEEWYRGTADAVRRNLRHLSSIRPEHILILGGDQLYRMDFEELRRFHVEHEADITIPVLPVDASRAPSFGILKTDAELRLTEFHEKPNSSRLPGLEASHPAFGELSGKTYLASMGIYFFNREVLFEVLSEARGDDFGKDIIPSSLSKYRVFGFPFNDYWEDIGTIQSFFKANLDLAVTDPRFSFYRETDLIYSRPRFLPCSKFLECDLKETLLAEGCLIRRSTIRHSVIGIRSIIGDGCQIEDTLMMGADFYESAKDRKINSERGVPNVGIGKSGRIKNAIIDKNARIGNNVEISNRDNRREFDGENYYVRDSIVIIPKNAVIPDYTVI